MTKRARVEHAVGIDDERDEAGDLRRFLASLTCRPRMTGNDFAVRVDYASWGVRTVSIRRRAMRRPAMVVMVTR